MMHALKAWWERRSALRQFSRMQADEEATVMLDDSNPLNRALVSIEIGDTVESLRCWRTARERYPALVRSRPESLRVLYGLERFDEAEELMTEGLRFEPWNPYFPENFADIYQRRRDFPEAVRRWTRLRKEFPGRSMAYAQGAAALRELKEIDEAETLISRTINLFPDDIHCRIERARVAEASGGWEVALERWDYVQSELHHVSGVIGAARALKNLGRSDEARERILSVRYQYSADREFSQVLEEYVKQRSG